MKIYKTKIDEVVLALLQLTSFGDHGDTRAWKGQDWEVMDWLYKKGYIHDPKGKAKSVVFTEKGLLESKELFKKHFRDTR